MAARSMSETATAAPTLSCSTTSRIPVGVEVPSIGSLKADDQTYLGVLRTGTTSNAPLNPPWTYRSGEPVPSSKNCVSPWDQRTLRT